MSNPGIPFDELLSKNCELGCFEIFVIAEQCERDTKLNFSPRKVISHLGITLNVLELTSINSTDDKKTIENLVDMAQMYAEKTLRPVINNTKNIKSYKLIADFCKSKLNLDSVCVPSSRVKYAKNRIITNQKTVIKCNNINIVSVAGGFPMGKVAIDSQISEVEHAILQGAREIDLVIDRGLTIDGDFQRLYTNINVIKNICTEKQVKLKTILSVVELESFTIVYKAAMTAMMAGSDFISTSTGMESQITPLCYGVVMCQAIRQYYCISGYQVGFKANGGILQHQHALGWLMLMRNMLGDEWMNTKYFRIGGFCGLFENVIKELCAALIKLN